MFHIQCPPRWSVSRNDFFLLPLTINPGGDIQNNLYYSFFHVLEDRRGEEERRDEELIYIVCCLW
jgi:hypothetical protein